MKRHTVETRRTVECFQSWVNIDAATRERERISHPGRFLRKEIIYRENLLKKLVKEIFRPIFRPRIWRKGRAFAKSRSQSSKLFVETNSSETRSNRLDGPRSVIYKYQFLRRNRTPVIGVIPADWCDGDRDDEERENSGPNSLPGKTLPISLLISQRSPLSHVLLARVGVRDWRVADVIRLKRRIDLSRLRITWR